MTIGLYTVRLYSTRCRPVRIFTELKLSETLSTLVIYMSLQVSHTSSPPLPTETYDYTNQYLSIH